MAPNGVSDNLDPGKYWVAIWTEKPWITAYSAGQHMLRSIDGFQATADQDVSGLSTYSSHGDNSGVPIDVQLCDISSSEACLQPCFDIREEPDWSDRDAACFWLVRMMSREADGTISHNTCFDGLRCSEEMLRTPADLFTECQSGYHGFASDVMITGQNHPTGQADAWVEITGLTAAGLGASGGLFALGSGFDAAAGVFTANVPGVYLTTAQVRLDNAEAGGGMSVAIMKNVLATDQSNADIIATQNGLLQTRTGLENAENPYFGFSLVGLVSLNAGDLLRVVVKGTADNDFYVQHETSFSAVLIQSTTAVSVAISASSTYTQTGAWTTPTATWLPPGTSDVGDKVTFTLMPQAAFSLATGTFTVTDDVLDAGAEEVIVFATASVQLTGADTGVFSASLSVSGEPVKGNNMQISASGAAGGSITLITSGTLRMVRGDSLTLYVRSSEDNAFSVDLGTRLSIAVLASTEGFMVQKKQDTIVTGQDGKWAELPVDGWSTPSGEDEASIQSGLFVSSLAPFVSSLGLSTSTGRYTAALPGVHFTSANVVLEGVEDALYLRAVIALDGQASEGGDDETSDTIKVNTGISTISGGDTAGTRGLPLAGLMYLDVGESISIFVRVEGDSDNSGYTVKAGTLFSAAFITSPPRTVVECVEPGNDNYAGDTCSTCIGNGASCSRCANVFGFDCRCACIQEQCTEPPNVNFGGDRCSDCLHSGASCAQCTERFGFDCSCACNEDGDWTQFRPDRCFGVDCGSKGMCHEGTCLCVDGFHGARCVLPPGRGMVCEAFVTTENAKCDLPDLPVESNAIDLGSADSVPACASRCALQAETGTSVASGCCERRDDSQCFYYPDVAAAVDSAATSLATDCAMGDTTLDRESYSLASNDCSDIRPVTERLVEAVLELHSQLQNRAWCAHLSAGCCISL
jgi:hypothetical protein